MKTKTAVAFRAVVLSPTFLIQGPPMKPSNNLENKTPSDIHWRVPLVCKKVLAHNSLKPTMEHNQD